MLSKLLKYDLKSMFKVFVPLWLALLAASLINRFTINLNSSMSDAIPTIVFMTAYVGLFIAVVVVAVALIIMRFYNGLLKDEGYLMFTLPVKQWQLVTSKCLSATILIILSSLVGLLSIAFITVTGPMLREVFAVIQKVIPHLTGDMVLFGVLCIVLLIVSALAAITQIYAALTLGHLANSHRIGFAVLAYIGLSMVFSFLSMKLFNFIGDLNWLFVDTLDAVNLGMLVVIGVLLVQVIVFYIITERVLTKRLNLE